MREKMKLVKGGIESVRASRRPPGVGWFRDKRTGLYLKSHVNKNIVVLDGLSAMFQWIQYAHVAQGGSIRYMEVGSGFTTPTKSDTQLVTAVLRVEIDAWDNDDIASDPVVMIASYLFDTTEANDALMECGLFQDSAGGVMFCRGLFGTGSISNATQADPVVITSVGHGLADGDKVYIEDVAGMTEINDLAFFVDVLDADTFALYLDSALSSSVDGTGYGAYTTASPDVDVWKLIIPKTSSETLTVNYSLSISAD